MMRLVNVTVWWFYLCLFIAFGLTHTLLPVASVFEYTNAIILAIVTGIAVTTAKDTAKALKAPARLMTPAQTLVVGMCTASVGSVLIFSGLWLRRTFPDVEFFMNGWPFSLGRWLFTGGAMLVLIAIGARSGVIGRRSYAVVGMLVGLAVGIAAISISITAH